MSEQVQLKDLPKVPPYQILVAASTKELAEKVSQKVTEGFRLVGQPFVFKNQICQARRAPKVTVTREGDTLCQKGCYPLALVFY